MLCLSLNLTNNVKVVDKFYRIISTVFCCIMELLRRVGAFEKERLILSVTLIRPEYAAKFHCDGRLCGSRCCREWEIVIDNATYEKYCALEPEKFRREVCGWLEKEDDAQRIRLKENGDCPFLREDYLCRIQREKGGDFLSDVCYSYPRMTYCCEDTCWQTLVMSCPVAARDLLSLQAPLKFEMVSVGEKRIGRCFDVTARVSPYGRYRWELKLAGVRFLQDESRSLSDRMVNMLFFYERIDEFIASSDEQGIKSLLLLSEAGVNFAPTKDHASVDAGSRRLEYMRLMMELYHEIYGSPTDEARLSELIRVYAQNDAAFVRDVLTGRQLALENYLVNEFFLRFYPFAYQGSLSENVRVFIMAWQVTEFGLRMMAAQEPLNLERLVLCISRLSDRLDHSKKTAEALQNKVRLLKLDSTEYARILLDF